MSIFNPVSMNNAFLKVGAFTVSPALAWALLVSSLMHALLIAVVDTESHPAPQPPAKPLSLVVNLSIEQPQAIPKEAVAISHPEKAVEPVAVVRPHSPVDKKLTVLPEAAFSNQRYYEARELDVLPQPLEAVALEYPTEALGSGVSGTVKLEMFLDERGNVILLSVLQADVPDVFDQAAINAFKNRKFKPGIKHGQPVKSRMKLTVKFGQDHALDAKP